MKVGTLKVGTMKNLKNAKDHLFSNEARWKTAAFVHPRCGGQRCRGLGLRLAEEQIGPVGLEPQQMLVLTFGFVSSLFLRETVFLQNLFRRIAVEGLLMLVFGLLFLCFRNVGDREWCFLAELLIGLCWCFAWVMVEGLKGKTLKCGYELS